MRLLPCVIATAALATALAACGNSSTSSSPSGALSGVSARQAVVQALQKAGTSPLKYDLGGTAGVDSSSLKNVPADLATSITGLIGSGGNITVAGRVEQESAARYRITLDLKPAVNATVTGVVYDGTFYYSLDGGKVYGSGGSLKSLTGVGFTPTDLNQLLGQMGDQSFKDLGPATAGGQPVEHYQVPLTVDDLVRALAPSSPGATPSAADQQNLQALAQLITLKGSSIDVQVAGDGHLAGYGVNLEFGVDVGRLAGLFGGGAAAGSAAPSGAINITLAVTSTVSDYGSPVTVTRPTVTPGAPRLPPGLGGGLLGG